jgi:hypothetical protein
MTPRFALVLLSLAISGCQATAGLQAVQGIAGQIPGAVGQLDDTVYAIAVAKYQSAQRFQAQINGTMPVLPPLPAVVTTPVPVAVMPTTPVPVVVVPTPTGTLPTGPTGK